jgi:hypothetical protein
MRCLQQRFRVAACLCQLQLPRGERQGGLSQMLGFEHRPGGASACLLWPEPVAWSCETVSMGRGAWRGEEGRWAIWRHLGCECSR